MSKKTFLIVPVLLMLASPVFAQETPRAPFAVKAMQAERERAEAPTEQTRWQTLRARIAAWLAAQ